MASPDPDLGPARTGQGHRVGDRRPGRAARPRPALPGAGQDPPEGARATRARRYRESLLRTGVLAGRRSTSSSSTTATSSTADLARVVVDADVVLLPYDSREQVTSRRPRRGRGRRSARRLDGVPARRRAPAGRPGAGRAPADPVALEAALRRVLSEPGLREHLAEQARPPARTACSGAAWPASTAISPRALVDDAPRRASRDAARSRRSSTCAGCRRRRPLRARRAHPTAASSTATASTTSPAALVVLWREPRSGPSCEQTSRGSYLEFVLARAVRRRALPQPAGRRPDLVGRADGRRLLGTGAVGPRRRRRGHGTRRRPRPGARRPSRRGAAWSLALAAGHVLRGTRRRRRARGAARTTAARSSCWPTRPAPTGRPVAAPGLAVARGRGSPTPTPPLPEVLLAAGAAPRPTAVWSTDGLLLLEWLLRPADPRRPPVARPGRRRGGPGDARPGFDQQPIEAAALADACARAFVADRRRAGAA